MWFIGTILGMVAGAAGGYLASLFELKLRQAANKARRRRAEPVARNEVAPPFWLPGALAGAVVAAVSSSRVRWLGAALPAFSAPVVAWLLLQALTSILDLIRRGRESWSEFAPVVSEFVADVTGSRLISNLDLSPGDIPGPDADYQSIVSFALTFDGYDHWGSVKACGEVANAALEAFVERRALPDSLTDLRTCLFFEQRRHQHEGRTPEGLLMEYVRALVGAIRERVLATERTQH